jgi:hypothetical protein
VRSRLLITSVVLLAAAAHGGAVELVLGPRALTEALDIGQSRIESLRTTFHRPYRVRVARPPVDYVEIVTPFRRVALAAETRARAGDRMFGQRDAGAILGDTPEQIDLLIELSFHPQNTFVGVPTYDVRLLPFDTAARPAEPRDIAYIPRFGPRLESGTTPYPYPMTRPGAPGGQAVVGGTILVRLDGRTIGPNGIYDVLVLDNGQELARARLDFRAIR